MSNEFEQDTIETEKKADIENKKKTGWFTLLGLPSFLYALVFTICLYKNTSGILVPVWAASTIGYAVYLMKKLGIAQKKDAMSTVAVMILLGIATVCTGNPYIIALNYAAFFLLLISWLLHHFYDDSQWEFYKQLTEIARAVLGAIGCLTTPFVEGARFVQDKRKTKSKLGGSIFLGVVASIPALFVLGLLLANADAVFANWLKQLSVSLAVPENVIGTFLMTVFAFLASYCGMRYLGAGQKVQKVKEIQKKEPVMAIAFTTMITVLYLIFSGIQIVYLFLGYGTLPEGMTYAEYARSGFFQLLFVCIANLCLVLMIRKLVQKNRVLTGILLTICGCTFIMIASSCYRMLLYIGTYHLTFLRIFVLVALAVIGLLMLGVILLLITDRFPLYRYSVWVVSIIYLLFAFSHVDYFIASYNLNHMTKETRVETLQYVGTLSTDAAPAIHTYLEQEKELSVRIHKAREAVIQGDEGVMYDSDEDVIWFLWYEKKSRLREKAGIRTFNISRAVASAMEW